MIALTVVVPTRDRPAQLAGCLAALLPELAPGDEVLVVDSASRAPVRRDLAPGVTVLRQAQPGTSRARNAGWRAAGCAVVAFVDDDVRVAPGWRLALGSALDGVDGVCGAVTVPPHQRGTERPVAVTPDVAGHLLTARQLTGVSANCAFDRSVLSTAGGFDERLGPGTWFAAAEDQELLARLVRSGARIRYAPEVLAHHDQWRTRRDLLRLDWGYGKGAGARVVMTGRADPRQARALAATALWEHGLGPVAGDVRKGYQFGVATGLVRTAGVCAGVMGALVRRDRP